MSHYSTLQDYRFGADAEDIRGSKIYDDRGVELAWVQDVVFDHGTGDIRYVVAKSRERRVLIPLSRLSRSTVHEDSFSSDLTNADIDQLPAFDEKSVSSQDLWASHETQHRSFLEKDKRFEKDFKANWKQDPVLHAKDDVAHSITPVEVAGGAKKPGSVRAERDDYVPDVTPKRIAPVFGATENTSAKLNISPQTDSLRTTAAETTSAGLGPKWNGFAERVRRDLHQIRGGCTTCKDERAA